LSRAGAVWFFWVGPRRGGGGGGGGGGGAQGGADGPQAQQMRYPVPHVLRGRKAYNGPR